MSDRSKQLASMIAIRIRDALFTIFGKLLLVPLTKVSFQNRIEMWKYWANFGFCRGAPHTEEEP